jgi:DNA-binding MarR family transcriptional regulator
MQLLEIETQLNATPEETAGELMDVVPRVMRALRHQMRRHRGVDLSVPEFRTLGFLNRHEGASLSQVADHIGLTLPSMSKLVDGLVGRKLVEREFNRQDRRRVTLALTGRGRAILQAARTPTQAHLAQVLSALTPDERATVVRAMQVLRPLFTSPREKEMQLTKGQHGNS